MRKHGVDRKKGHREAKARVQAYRASALRRVASEQMKAKLRGPSKFLAKKEYNNKCVQRLWNDVVIVILPSEPGEEGTGGGSAWAHGIQLRLTNSPAELGAK